MRRNFFLLLLLFSIPLISGAQNRILQGIVHTMDSIPLDGVQIQVKSSGQTYATNTYGVFVVECGSTDKLKIKADGFYGRTIKIEDNLKFVAINLKIKPGNEQVSYSFGYENIKDSENTSAISSISYKDIDFNNYNDIQEIIQVNFAGVQVTNNGIVIRGTKSLISSSAPLVVIDGIISNSGFNYLHPLEVKRITVLKDGTAAIYGSRGANGVILIETKEGGDN